MSSQTSVQRSFARMLFYILRSALAMVSRFADQAGCAPTTTPISAASATPAAAVHQEVTNPGKAPCRHDGAQSRGQQKSQADAKNAARRTEAAQTRRAPADSLERWRSQASSARPTRGCAPLSACAMVLAVSNRMVKNTAERIAVRHEADVAHLRGELPGERILGRRFRRIQRVLEQFVLWRWRSRVLGPGSLTRTVHQPTLPSPKARASSK